MYFNFLIFFFFLLLEKSFHCFTWTETMSFTLCCKYLLYNIIATLRFPTGFPIRLCVKHLHTSKKNPNILVQNLPTTTNCSALLWKKWILSKCVFAIGKDAAEEKVKTACKTTKQQNTLLVIGNDLKRLVSIRIRPHLRGEDLPSIFLSLSKRRVHVLNSSAKEIADMLH